VRSNQWLSGLRPGQNHAELPNLGSLTDFLGLHIGKSVHHSHTHKLAGKCILLEALVGDLMRPLNLKTSPTVCQCTQC
jgi:hypothetical protein